jgi:hypothetical protein
MARNTSTGRLLATLGIAAALLTQLACVSHLRTYRITDDNTMPLAAKATNGQGIYYALPQTVLTVSAPVSKKTTSPGPNFEFAEHFFRTLTTRVAKETRIEFELGEATISSRGVPDPEHVYLVKIRGGRWEDLSLGLELAEQGSLTKFDASVTNKATDFWLQVAQTGASLIGQVMTGAAESQAGASRGNDQECEAVDFSEQDKKFCLALASAYRPYFKKMRAAERDQARQWPVGVYEALRRAFTDVDKLYDDEPRLQQFIAAAEDFTELSALTKSRKNLLSVTGNTPAETWAKAMDGTNARIHALTQRFFGIERTNPRHWAGTFDVNPKQELDVILFRLNSSTGICGIVTGNPAVSVVNRIEAPACGADGRDQAVQLKVGRTSGLDYTDPVERFRKGQGLATSGENGLFYRIPALVQVRVSAGTSEMAQAQVAVAQMGTIAVLPTTTGGRKTQYAASLYPATGALKSILVTHEAAITAANAQAAGNSTSTLLTAAARREQQDAPPSELATLEKERKLAEERIRLLRAEACLDNPFRDGCPK